VFVSSHLIAEMALTAEHLRQTGPARLPACQTDNRRVLAVLRYLGS
jgi:hypothetical protein